MKNSTLPIFVRLTSIALICLFFSCEKDELDFNGPNTETATTADINNYRRKVVNPYTIPNMQKAINDLIARIGEGKLKSTTNSKASIPINTQIVPNILYVKFTPQTPEEEGLLKQDSTLALIDYPLGYEYDEAFFENRPPLKEGEIPAYYTTVSVDRELPAGVPYEVLEEMYLPQEDENLEAEGKSPLYKTAKGVTADFVSVLLQQAFEQTGNEGLDGLGIIKKKHASSSKFLGIGIGEKWLPRGTLRIWDDNIGKTTTRNKIFVRWEYYDCDTDLGGGDRPYQTISGNGIIKIDRCRRAIYRYDYIESSGSYVPLAGAQVLLRDTFTIGNEITNSEGYFQFDHKRGQKRYIIQWERYQYSIRDGQLYQAETRGPKQNTRWDHDIKGGEDAYHAMIHLAAYDYYYGSRFGLTSPPTIYYNNQMKIAARERYSNDKSSYSHSKNDLTAGIAAQIHIKAWGEDSEDVYGTTIHELAHAAHSVVDRDSYDNVVRDAWIIPWQGGAVVNNNRRLLETWAATVEIMFVLKRYKDNFNQSDYVYNGFYPYYKGSRQDYKISDENHYTSGGYDMIDDFNQRDHFGDEYPKDRVTGYTIKELETALIGAKSWWQWRDNIKSLNNSNSTKHI